MTLVTLAPYFWPFYTNIVFICMYGNLSVEPQHIVSRWRDPVDRVSKAHDIKTDASSPAKI